MTKYVDRKAVQRERLDQTVHLTGYDALYGHARFVAVLRSSAGFRPNWVGYEILEWPRVALDGLRAQVDGAVPIKWAPNERTCLIPFGPILAKHAELAVGRGWIRPIPFAVEDGRIILDLSQGKPRRSEPQRLRAAARERWERLPREEKERLVAKARERARKRLVQVLQARHVRKK
jgi:hypothetical protein